MRKVEDVLETYLAQIVSGARVPAPEAGLEPMLRVATQMHQVGSIEPSPASVERIRLALRRVPVREAGARSTTPRLGLWRRPVMGLAFAMLLLTLGTTSALAAPSALPDSPLYPVRNWREALQVQFAGTSARRATLYAMFAAERTMQLRRLAEHKSRRPRSGDGRYSATSRIESITPTRKLTMTARPRAPPFAMLRGRSAISSPRSSSRASSREPPVRN